MSEEANRLVVADPWSDLRHLTPANIAIGRVGHSLPTREILRFGIAHAQARDAVHVPLDLVRLASDLHASHWPCISVSSAAATREIYLRRPDLGRRLAAGVQDSLVRVETDLCFVISDGLSAIAAQTHAVPLLNAIRVRTARSIAPIVIATQARVALGDEIAERSGARMVVVLIGERPGLSSPDSLGIYLTWAPLVGRTDAERNCISNVRAGGLSYSSAAAKLTWLIDAAFRRQLTGVALKDESSCLSVEP